MKDFSENELELGDLVLDTRQKLWLVQATDRSVYEVGRRIRCKPWHSNGEAVLMPKTLIVKVTADEVVRLGKVLDKAELSRLWQHHAAHGHELLRAVLKQRHQHFEQLREKHLGHRAVS